jgi:transposase
MPWKECSVMDERLQFVARRLAGEPMAELCREFGISSKTGYKNFDRYKECGVQGLTDRSRRPYRYAHQLPFQRAGRPHHPFEARWTAHLLEPPMPLLQVQQQEGFASPQRTAYRSPAASSTQRAC